MNMSDESDNDLYPLTNNFPAFQTQGMTIYAKGPGISTNVPGLSLRNNVMTSTMNRPCNLERPQYTESVCDQRSMSYRRERETSPMSYHSASGFLPRNFQSSYYAGGMSRQRSIYNGRSGSPMSVRTIDSNTSMSAKDIFFGFQNKYSKSELKLIQDGYNRYIKPRVRRRVEKRRNVRAFLKGFRRRSGGVSGDEASESSSGSDCGSTRTSKSIMYKENMSSCRSTRTDISGFRRKIRESNMVRDISDSFRNKPFQGMISGSALNARENLQNLQGRHNTTSISQEDRFKKGFILPSQRFNQSTASLTIQGNPVKLQRINEVNIFDVKNSAPTQNCRAGTKNRGTDSEQEEIFANVTTVDKSSINKNCKRKFEDPPGPNKKKPKLSPQAVTPKPKTPKQKQPSSITKRKADFEFAKPQLPIKKPTIVKQKSVLKSSQHQQKTGQLNTEKPREQNLASKPDTTTTSVDQMKEKVISSSHKAVQQMNTNSSLLEPTKSNIEKTKTQLELDRIAQEKEFCMQSNNTLHSTTDTSMRPSFIKRKLFTQKVDIAEKNSSSDSLQADSPQTNVYSKIQKEKHRARKLVTTQSCLSRHVADESNLLELIQKVVPAERLNMTSAANRTEIKNDKSNPANAEKWDVTSIITTCNNTDNVSDTYTDDEEIFTENSENQQINKKNTQKEDEKQKYNVKEHTKGKVDTQPAKEAKKKAAVNEKKNTDTQQINSKKQQRNTPKASKVVSKKCAAMIGSNPSKEFIAPAPVNNVPTEKIGIIMACEYKSGKSFWDTDTESDLDHTPSKGIYPKQTYTLKPQVVAKTPVKNIPVNPLANEKLAVNKTINAAQKKIIPKRKVKEQINKNNEGNCQNNQSKNTIETTKPVQVREENKKRKEVPKEVIVKIKAVDKSHIIKKANEKLPVSDSRKENHPHEVLRQETKSLNSQRDLKSSQKSMGKITVNQVKNKINNNDSTVDNNMSQHNSISIHNNTMRARAQRKPKVNKCCGEDNTTLHSVANNTLSKSLRSRQIDLSTSLEFDDGDSTVIKNTTVKNKKLTKNYGRKNEVKKTNQNDSDISFTLTEIIPMSKSLRNRTIYRSTANKARKSDVSFTLTTKNKTINSTVSTRSSRRNRELDSLLHSSASFLKLGKKSPLNKKVAAESIAMNRTSNRSRRLL